MPDFERVHRIVSTQSRRLTNPNPYAAIVWMTVAFLAAVEGDGTENCTATYRIDRETLKAESKRLYEVGSIVRQGLALVFEPAREGILFRIERVG